MAMKVKPKLKPLDDKAISQEADRQIPSVLRTSQLLFFKKPVEALPLLSAVCKVSPVVMGPIRLPAEEHLPPLQSELEISKAKAEVIHISEGNPPAPPAEDDSVALNAWLEAYAGFCNDPKMRRVEYHLVEDKHGKEYLKKIYVNKVFACWLQPGDHFGDPDGKRHKTTGGYPTRDFYEKAEDKSRLTRVRKVHNDTSLVHAIDKEKALRLVSGENSRYEGPQWDASLSTQQVIAGFLGYKRPPSLAEVLRSHWESLAAWHGVDKEITMQQEFTLRRDDQATGLPKDKSVTVVRTWQIRDASCWGHTLLDNQGSMQGTIRPPTDDALELLSSQQTDLEAANHPDFSEYGSPLTDLELRREVGKEFVRNEATDSSYLLPLSNQSTKGKPGVYSASKIQAWLDDGKLIPSAELKPAPLVLSREVDVFVGPLPRTQSEPEEQVCEAVPITDWNRRLPHLKRNGFQIQSELQDRLLSEVRERRRVEMLILDNEEINRAAEWRQVSNTLFETLTSDKYAFPRRNLGFSWWSNAFPADSDNLYERWWDEVVEDSEEYRLQCWLLEHQDFYWFIIPKSRFSKPDLGKVKINYVDRLETREVAPVIDLTVPPKAWVEDAVDLTKLLFQPEVVPQLTISLKNIQEDYGEDLATGLYLPKHLNMSPSDFKKTVLAPERRRLGIMGRIRGVIHPDKG